ncbi:hypothetical protein [Bifidobacterium lemurum]|uniref:hypothetical protein n=1 Tax=Bifidobacterium lemurum TaxID=1603886 RepID=UPI001F465313|nr:hypothetical protein [Bifidobacterium lemurum]
MVEATNTISQDCEWTSLRTATLRTLLRFTASVTIVANIIATPMAISCGMTDCNTEMTSLILMPIIVRPFSVKTLRRFFESRISISTKTSHPREPTTYPA